MRRTDALIVGGGPAGSAAAITLAEAGREVLVLEKSSRAHDTVCGGFVGWDALAALRALGVDAPALGARPIDKARLVSDRSLAEFALPRTAAGLSRRTLDEALLDRARGAGASIERGTAVRDIEPASKCVRLSGGERLDCALLCLATGKHHVRGAPPRRGDDLSLGLRIAVAPDDRMARALAETVELHLYDGGYAGALIQEDGNVNFCLSVREQTFRDAGSIETLLDRLADSNPALRPLLDRPRIGDWSTISGVPYGWRQRRSAYDVRLLGDRAAVIASLAGDGIAIALESGRRVMDPRFQGVFAEKAKRPVALASLLRSAAESDWMRPALMTVARRAPGLATRAARLTQIR